MYQVDSTAESNQTQMNWNDVVMTDVLSPLRKLWGSKTEWLENNKKNRKKRKEKRNKKKKRRREKGNV